MVYIRKYIKGCRVAVTVVVVMVVVVVVIMIMMMTIDACIS
jgi:hypothetical protein